jgi:hypothetical protein
MFLPAWPHKGPKVGSLSPTAAPPSMAVPFLFLEPLWPGSSPVVPWPSRAGLWGPKLLLILAHWQSLLFYGTGVWTEGLAFTKHSTLKSPTHPPPPQGPFTKFCYWGLRAVCLPQAPWLSASICVGHKPRGTAASTGPHDSSGASPSTHIGSKSPCGIGTSSQLETLCTDNFLVWAAVWPF